MNLEEIMQHGFFTNFPELMPVSTLSCPPSTAFMAQYMGSSEFAPKPGFSPSKAPNAKDIATFECDLAENDDAQIISTRQTSVQSHRRLESQDKIIKFNRPKDTVSNERGYMLKTDRVMLKKCASNGIESSRYGSPKRHANYLQINLAKLDDNDCNKEQQSGKKIPNIEEQLISPNVKMDECDEHEEPKNLIEKQNSKASSISVEKASNIGQDACGKLLVSKWIDYSSKYGLGYQLSNGVYGVLFNDSTKIVMSKDHYQFYYLKRESSSKNADSPNVPVYDFNNYPDDLKKKVVLTQHFVSYLLGEKFVPSRTRPSNFEKEF
jgi:hypothetical protein